MGVISRSAQARVSFVGSRLLALACMIELVVRRLLRACLAEGLPAHVSSLILRILLVDMNARSTIGDLQVCVKRVKVPATVPHPVDLQRGNEQFSLDSGAAL